MKVNHNIGEQRVMKWWEHSSPTNVAQVQILSISDIIMLLCKVFPQLLWFSLLLNYQYVQIVLIWTALMHLNQL